MADKVSRLVVSGQLVAKPQVKHHLVCFPWAGAGASFYIRWDALFPTDIQVHGVRLPGREVRFQEDPYLDVAEVARDAAECIHARFANKPFSFYGHSLGSRLSFETALELRRRYGLQPRHLFVSGGFAPHSKRGRASIETRIPSVLTEDTLIQYLKNNGATPAAVLANPDMLSLVLPPLKADLTMLLRHRYDLEEPPPLTCSIVAMDGDKDIAHHLEEWSQLTTGGFDTRQFSGGHFFLLESERQKELADYITGLVNSS